MSRANPAQWLVEVMVEAMGSTAERAPPFEVLRSPECGIWALDAPNRESLRRRLMALGICYMVEHKGLTIAEDASQRTGDSGPPSRNEEGA